VEGLDRRLVTRGLGFAEGPRWRDGQLWFSDFGSRAVWTVGDDGDRRRVVEVSARPSGLGWLPDGRLLIVSMEDRRLLRLENGELVMHADLSGLATYMCNDMVVDAAGRAYVGNFGFDLRANPPQKPRPAEIVLVAPSGEASVVDDEVMFPNGSVITPDGGTLIVAETFGARLTAFDIQPDGRLANRRTWASLPGRFPDGICLDADGAVWVADARGRTCLRVAEGGEVLGQVDTDRNCYACMLGGTERRTLFLCIADGSGSEHAGAGTAAIEAVEVEVPGAGLP
jgi:sugar lactone lactonase YvrE